VTRFLQSLKTRQALLPSLGRNVVKSLDERYRELIFPVKEDVNARQWASLMFSLLVTLVKTPRPISKGLCRTEPVNT